MRPLCFGNINGDRSNGISKARPSTTEPFSNPEEKIWLGYADEELAHRSYYRGKDKTWCKSAADVFMEYRNDRWDKFDLPKPLSRESTMEQRYDKRFDKQRYYCQACYTRDTDNFEQMTLRKREMIHDGSTKTIEVLESWISDDKARTKIFAIAKAELTQEDRETGYWQFWIAGGGWSQTVSLGRKLPILLQSSGTDGQKEQDTSSEVSRYDLRKERPKRGAYFVEPMAKRELLTDYFVHNQAIGLTIVAGPRTRSASRKSSSRSTRVKGVSTVPYDITSYDQAINLKRSQAEGRHTSTSLIVPKPREGSEETLYDETVLGMGIRPSANALATEESDEEHPIRTSIEQRASLQFFPNHVLQESTTSKPAEPHAESSSPEPTDRIHAILRLSKPTILPIASSTASRAHTDDLPSIRSKPAEELDAAVTGYSSVDGQTADAPSTDVAAEPTDTFEPIDGPSKSAVDSSTSEASFTASNTPALRSSTHTLDADNNEMQTGDGNGGAEVENSA